MLEVDQIGFRYGSKPVLRGVSATFEPGATVLLGRNGAGKTTLIRILAGAAVPSGGQVRLNGSAQGSHSRATRAVLRRIGWLPQTFGFPPRMATAEFVAYAAWLKEVPGRQLTRQVADALATTGLSDQARNPLQTLSGGQLRRAGLAAALVAEPEVLVLDEPTAGLDPEQRDAFHGLVRRIRSERVVVIATHLLEDVEALADRVVVIDRGSVQWTGTIDDLAGLSQQQGLSALREGFQIVLDRAVS
ncbi:ATP-binding cassette domain-containing protein [Solwaraspora sp. WMMB762]|uniref:ATP-binding cassette domain-containing protein n=1 Tax=Solwaraspora sp. WMMB762 TaxID=3404120 RepID=UPI003B95C202